MRRDDPVHRHADSPYGPYWSVTRYADIMKVELDHASYSSASEMGGIQIADQATTTANLSTAAFSVENFVEHVVPTSIFKALADGEILQIVVFSIF